VNFYHELLELTMVSTMVKYTRTVRSSGKSMLRLPYGAFDYETVGTSLGSTMGCLIEGVRLGLCRGASNGELLGALLNRTEG